MELIHIPLDQLKPSILNVRKKGGKDVAGLAASIRSLGLLQPLLVRRNCEGFDIIAGQRRYTALALLSADGASVEPAPCMVMEEDDDATAIEASLAENIARLPMDEIDQYKAFAALRGEGVSVSDIAAKFGVTERLVEQRLAIANIIPPILNAYRREDIRPETLRILTMATPKQQKAWWKLHQSDDDYAPTGRSLRDWLFGGAQIPVSNALFDVSAYEGAIVSDLFGEEGYFADSDAFWTLQQTAIAAMRQTYLDAGWREVETLDIGQHFATWNHAKTARTKGGRVYIAVSASGEVTTHEGWLPEKEARQRAKAANGGQGENDGTDAAPPVLERSELTSAMRNYLGLHRHAAVRTELLDHPALALRLVVAHIIAGSPLWKVEAEPQRAATEAIADSLARSRAQAVFAGVREAIAAQLGIEAGEHVTKRRYGYLATSSVEDIFIALTNMLDDEVFRILTFVMAETLAAHSTLTDRLGEFLAVDMKTWWSPDETFFALLRDKKAVNAMLREVAGDVTADAHLASTAKVQKKIISDCFAGDGRAKVENWLPRYLRFPAATYLGASVDAVTAGPETAVDGDANVNDINADIPDPIDGDNEESGIANAT
jgi:ParB family chromosome partitioning protein